MGGRNYGEWTVMVGRSTLGVGKINEPEQELGSLTFLLPLSIWLLKKPYQSKSETQSRWLKSSYGAGQPGRQGLTRCLSLSRRNELC
jgi:hypothetical protein